MKRSALRATDAVLTAVLILMMVMFISHPALATAPGAVQVPGVERDTAKQELPLQGRYAISAALGKEQESYHLISQNEDLRAPNPAQSFTARFSPEGLIVETPTASLAMSLSAVGYGKRLVPVQPARPQARTNRAEYRRGPLTEWYVNGPFGLQQGFTLDAPPAATADQKAPLILALSLKGTLTAQLKPDRRSLVFTDGDTTARFTYTGLTVTDAEGNEAPSWLEVHGTTLSITVDDRGMRYPLTIDPFFQAAKLTASDGAASDLFGSSVAVSGDTVVVGAFGDDDAGNWSGSVYVFEKPVTGWPTMTETAKLTASDGAALENFGYSVAVSGDTVVVGAPGADIGGNSSQGAAYVFVRPAAGWADMTETGKLTASDGAAEDQFGASVAVSGDTVVVGTPADDDRGDASGSVYVFEKPVTGWATMPETAKLTASDGAADDNCGRSVAVSGDTVVVGAPGDDDRGDDSGSVYVFERPVTGWATMTETVKFTASDGAADDYFGYSVAASGDTVVAGAYRDDDWGDDSGSVYVFSYVPPGITVTPTSGITTTEAGGTASFTVVLDASPTAAVTIDLSSSNTAEGTVSPGSLTFTTGNWYVPRTVTVTGVDDSLADGNQVYTIVTDPAESTDTDYDGLDTDDVTVTNVNDDTAGGDSGGGGPCFIDTAGCGFPVAE